MERPPKPVVLLNASLPWPVWSWPEEASRRLAARFPEAEFPETRDRASFAAALPGADALLTWTLPPDLLPSAKRLRWVHTPEDGVDRLLSPALAASGIAVTNSRGATADAVADHAMALLYAATRRIALCRDAQSRGEWIREKFWEDAAAAPFVLAGRTMLVVGVGEVGRGVARRARAAGMKVVGARRTDAPPPPEFDAVVPAARLDDALGAADVVVLAAPITAATRGLFDAERIAKLRPGAVFVNVGRGGLVDLDPLLEALEAGRIDGAGLDVFPDEPPAPDHAVWREPRVVLTPHIGGTAPGTMDKVEAIFAENVARWLAGRPLLNVVDATAGY